MVKVYAIQLNEDHNETICQQYLQIAPTHRKHTLSLLTNEDDMYRSVIGDLLARHIALTYAGISPHEYIIEYTAHGKPYLQANPDFHVNIAHSGKWVVCTTDTQPVGIDIEQIAPIDTDLYRTYLSPSEYVALRSMPAARHLHHFYELWTLKESYLKQAGTGLSVSPASFSIIENCDQYHLMALNGKRLAPVHFMQYNIDKDYKVAVCAANPTFAPLEIINIADITV